VLINGLKAVGRGWLGYCIWLIIVTAAALIARLPSDLAADYLQDLFLEMVPGYHLAVTEVAVSPLLRLNVSGCRVVANGTDEPLLQADQVLVSPSLLALCLGRKRIRFSASAYGGNVQGDVLSRADAVFPDQLSLQVRGIQLQRYHRTVTLLGSRLTGEVSGDIAYNGEGGFGDGTGHLKFRLRNGAIALPEAIFGFTSFDLGEVNVAIEINKRKAVVTSFSLAGREGHGTISGTVNMQQRLSRSRLSLKGEFEPDQHALRETAEGETALRMMQEILRNGKIRIAVGGTVGQPEIRLL